MASALRPVGHEDRLSIVEHLDELRNRLIVSVAFFAVVFGLCAWQNQRILDIINRPLERTARTSSTGRSKDPLEQQATFARLLRPALMRQAEVDRRLAQSSSRLSAPERLELARAAKALAAAAAAAPAELKRRPVTLGVTEPFLTTFTVAAWAALLLALPFLLYQLYAFVLPAFTMGERRVAVPLMAMVPGLFIAGVLFGYFLALPPALRFLQNFNDGAFDVLVQARPYYRFVVLMLGAMGLAFQVPVGILLITRLGLVSTRQLRTFRRYAIVIAAIVAAVITPSVDPATMLIVMAPLVVLYELSILLASLFAPRTDLRAADEPISPNPTEG
jgi:sec-independent protein translocase protein TatC